MAEEEEETKGALRRPERQLERKESPPSGVDGLLMLEDTMTMMVMVMKRMMMMVMMPLTSPKPPSAAQAWISSPRSRSRCVGAAPAAGAERCQAPPVGGGGTGRRFSSVDKNQTAVAGHGLRKNMLTCSCLGFFSFNFPDL